MSSITKALCWALVILAVALAGRAGLMSSESAQAFAIVLPLLAVVTLFKARTCTMACLRSEQA